MEVQKNCLTGSDRVVTIKTSTIAEEVFDMIDLAN